jgi:hypothetical protein
LEDQDETADDDMNQETGEETGEAPYQAPETQDETVDDGANQELEEKETNDEVESEVVEFQIPAEERTDPETQDVLIAEEATQGSMTGDADMTESLGANVNANEELQTKSATI